MPPATPSRPLPACFCGSVYDTHEHLHQHVLNKGHRYECEVDRCPALGRDPTALASSTRHSGSGHQGAVELPAFTRYESNPAIDTVRLNVCVICRGAYANADGVAAHKRDSHPCCPSCYQVFARKRDLEGHQRASGHFYCHEHSIAFSGDRAFRNHERAEPHITGFECLDCGRHFRNEVGLSDHIAGCQARDPDRVADQTSNTAAAATISRVEEEDLRCEACDRKFSNLHAQRQHKKSVKHNPLSEIRCFLSPRCQQVFTSPSAYIFHLESGKCKSGMTRHRLNCLVHAGDATNRITYQDNTRRLAPAGEADAASLLSALGRMSLTSTSDVMFTPSQSGATSSSGTHRQGRVHTPEDDDASSTVSGATVRGDARGSISGRATGQTRASSLQGLDAVSDSGDTVASTTTSFGGVLLTPASSEAGGEWSFVPGYPGGGADVLQYDGLRQGWVCQVCDKVFRKQKWLFDHLSSPAHEVQLYHCAGVTHAVASSEMALRKPVKKFKTLSGFAQHIEAGSCTGGKEVLDTVVGIFENEIRGATGQNVSLLRRR